METKQHIYKKVLFIILIILCFTIIRSSDLEAQNDINQAKHLLKITDGVTSPLRLAIDSEDNVYVTDAIGGKICKYDSSGNFIDEFLVDNFPLAIAVNFQGMIYIGNRLNGKFQLLDPGGGLLKIIETDIGGFELPSNAAIDDLFQLYVVDSKRKSVLVFNENNNYLFSFGQEYFSFPTGIAFDQKNNRILVAEHGGLNTDENSKMIHVFDMLGNWQNSFGEYGNDPGQFSRIQGITVDQWGRIFVTDSYQGTIVVLKQDGELLATIGQFGTDAGQLRAPMDVALDSQNRLWVTNMNNGCLDVFDINQIPTPVIPEEQSFIPLKNELLQNYPNPFNLSTRIPFILTKSSSVIISIYNQIGKKIKTLDLGDCSAGVYISNARAPYWDGKNDQGKTVSSGLYFYKIHADDFISVRRMVFLK